ncbi:MAG: hypothetical protein ACN4GR_08315 [Arenicellales bacterium]
MLLQDDNSGFSVPVVFRGKAQYAQAMVVPLSSTVTLPREAIGAPEGLVCQNVQGSVAPLAKDYGHSLRGAPYHER